VLGWKVGRCARDRPCSLTTYSTGGPGSSVAVCRPGRDGHFCLSCLRGRQKGLPHQTETPPGGARPALSARGKARQEGPNSESKAAQRLLQPRRERIILHPPPQGGWPGLSGAKPRQSTETPARCAGASEDLRPNHPDALGKHTHAAWAWPLRDLRFLRGEAPGGKGRTPKAKRCEDFRNCGANGLRCTPLPPCSRTIARQSRPPDSSTTH
jgi:hypothetical protein